MSDNYFEKGEGVINSHTKHQYKPRKALTFTVLQCSYVENVSFNFEPCEKIERGVQVIHNIFSCFGLDIHIGKSLDGNINAPKTECVLFSLPQFFDNNIPYWKEEIGVENANSFSTKREREETVKKKAER